MEIFLIVIVVVCVIAAIIKFTSGSDNTSQSVNANLTDEQKQWLQKVGDIFRQNKALPFNKEETKHDGYDVFTSYQWAIAERYRLQQNELSTIDSAQYGLNLQKEEIVYHRINSVILHQEKTTRYNIAYSGVRWQSGMMRAGSMSVIGNEITRFIPMDIGRLFITNQRILFVGKQKNITKSIPIQSVLYYNLYQDGALVHMPNKKPILLKFEIGYNAEIVSVEDGLNEFLIVLDRIISGTETQKLPE